jgi:hypothetical protein
MSKNLMHCKQNNAKRHACESSYICWIFDTVTTIVIGRSQSQLPWSKLKLYLCNLSLSMNNYNVYLLARPPHSRRELPEYKRRNSSCLICYWGTQSAVFSLWEPYIFILFVRHECRPIKLKSYIRVTIAIISLHMMSIQLWTLNTPIRKIDISPASRSCGKAGHKYYVHVICILPTFHKFL